MCLGGREKLSILPDLFNYHVTTYKCRHPPENVCYIKYEKGVIRES